MRKKDREITNTAKIDAVIRSCDVCRVAFAVDNEAYIVPMNFGYDGKHLYFHTALNGKKINMISENDRVCFEFDTDVRITGNENTACKWTCRYKSVIGYGRITELVSESERMEGLNHIMQHYSGRHWTFDKPVFRETRIWKIEIEQLTGKEAK